MVAIMVEPCANSQSPIFSCSNLEAIWNIRIWNSGANGEIRHLCEECIVRTLPVLVNSKCNFTVWSYGEDQPKSL